MPTIRQWHDESETKVEAHFSGAFAKLRGATISFMSVQLQASAAMETRTALFRAITQQVLLISYGRFKTTYRAIFKGPESEERSFPPFSVRTEQTQLPLDGFSWNLIFECFSKICQKNQVSLKSETKNGYIIWGSV